MTKRTVTKLALTLAFPTAVLVFIIAYVLSVPEGTGRRRERAGPSPARRRRGRRGRKAARTDLPEGASIAALADPDTRARALRELARKRGKAASACLKNFSSDKDPAVRIACIQMLASLGDKSAAAAIKLRVYDGVARVRVEAVKALGKLLCDEAYAGLIDALKDRDASVRTAAARQLAAAPDAVAAPALIRALGDKVVDVRAAAAEALAKLPPQTPDARHALLRALRDAEPRVRLAVVGGLGSADDVGAATAFAAALDDADASVREFAADALSRMGAKCVDGIAAALEPRTGAGAVAAAVPILAALRSPEAVAGLVRVLEVTDPAAGGRDREQRLRARQQAVEALVAVGDAVSRPLADAVFERLMPLHVKRAAAEALARVGAASGQPIADHVLKWKVYPNPDELDVWVAALERIGTPQAKRAATEARKRRFTPTAAAPDAPVPTPATWQMLRDVEPALPKLGPNFTGELRIVLEGGLYTGNPPRVRRRLVLDGQKLKEVPPRSRPAWKPKGRAHLILDFAAQSGRWRRVWGVGRGFNNGDHYGEVLRAELSENAARFSVQLRIERDPWVRGGWAEYRIDLDRKPQRQGFVRDLADVVHLEGTYEGVFRGLEIAGRARCTLKPLRPVRVKDFTPLAAGEHPRILFRKSDLPRLRAKAATPFGRAAVKAFMQSDDPIAVGVLYQLTGDPRYAEIARPIVSRHMADKSLGFMGLGQIWGPRLTKVSVAYDLCYDAWPQSYRREVQRYLLSTMRKCFFCMNALSTPPNWHPCSNYHGPIRGGGAISSLAMWGDRGPPPQRPGSAGEIEHFAPASDYQPGKGVPVGACKPGKAPPRWLWSGTLDGAFATEDILADLGGLAAARPQVGTTFSYQGRTLTFRPLDDRQAGDDGIYACELMGITGPSKEKDVTAAFFTVVRVDEPCFRHVGIGGPGTFTVVLAGRRIYDGSVIRLERGLYPLLCLLSVRKHSYLSFRPSFFPIPNEATAKALVARNREAAVMWRHDRRRWEQSGRMDPQKMHLFHVGCRQMYRSYRQMMGTGGFQTEGESYTVHGAHCPLYYAVAYRKMFGRDVSPYPDVTHFPLRYVMASAFCGGHEDKRGRWRSGRRMQSLNGGGAGPLARWIAIGFPIVPERYKPGVLWAWNRIMGVQDKASRANVLAESPVMAFLHYPLDLEPVHPAKCLPLTYQAPTKGLYVFRSGWNDGDEIITQVFLKSQINGGWGHANAGTVVVQAFGKTWAQSSPSRGQPRCMQNVVLLPEDDVQEGACGQPTHVERRDDGSGVVCVDLNDLYARGARYDGNCLRIPRSQPPGEIRGMRAVAVDYSGACGAEGLLVVVDRIRGGGRREWLWHLGEGAAPVIDGNTFTVTQGQASMKATFVAPAGVRLKFPHAYSTAVGPGGRRSKDGPTKRSLNAVAAVAPGGTPGFFVVFTLQKGRAPAVSARGRGLDAAVRVGRRTVRFDGQKIVLGEAQP